VVEMPPEGAFFLSESYIFEEMTNEDKTFVYDVKYMIKTVTPFRSVDKNSGLVFNGHLPRHYIQGIYGRHWFFVLERQSFACAFFPPKRDN
jgi:hypothetical protein